MISIITCTNRDTYFQNIIENYQRQNWKEKELIIILNNDELQINDWQNRLNEIPNVKIDQLGENKTLGECLNHAINQTSYNYIAKMDDDDYYATDYLPHSLKTLKESHAKVVGKTTIYMYFENDQSLQLFNPYRFAGEKLQGSEQIYNPKVLMGGTLFFEKSLNKNIPFRSCNVGEDAQFCDDCIKNKITLYSGTRDHYVYIRKDAEFHTWKIKNKNLLKYCLPIMTTADFRPYISNSTK